VVTGCKAAESEFDSCLRRRYFCTP